jgi:hypothetical protein
MKTGHFNRPINRQIQYKDVDVDNSNNKAIEPKVELFFLVEYRENNQIQHRWLFRNSEEAKNHIEKELYCKYNRNTSNWDSSTGEAYAKIVTLTI